MGPIQLQIDDDGRNSSRPDPVVICLARDQITDINLWLKSSDVEMELADVFVHTAGGYHGLGIRGERAPPSLEEATGMSLDEFYETYLAPSTQVCLEASPALGALSE
jgi:hypothetical protein